MKVQSKLNGSYFIIFLSIGSFFLINGCSFNNNRGIKNEIISVQSQYDSQQLSQYLDSTSIIRVAVSSMLSPKETHIFYQDLFRYMSEKLGYDIEFIQRKTYKEINDLLIHNKIDLALICSGGYIEKEMEGQVQLLVVPIENNKPFYNSYIIVNKESKITKIEDLEYKKFAFTDPLSNTGTLYPKYLVMQLGKNPNTYFSKTVYSYGHDISMQLVAKGIVDGAAIDALIYNYCEVFFPERIKNLKIIKESPDFGIPPLVVPIKLNVEVKDKLRKFFLNIHKDSIGNKILKKLLIEKFMIGYDKNYNSIREMKQALKQ